MVFFIQGSVFSVAIALPEGSVTIIFLVLAGTNLYTWAERVGHSGYKHLVQGRKAPGGNRTRVLRLGFRSLIHYASLIISGERHL